MRKKICEQQVNFTGGAASCSSVYRFQQDLPPHTLQYTTSNRFKTCLIVRGALSKAI